MTSLKGDYFNYSEETYELIGENSNKHYKLGQTVKVIVAGTDEIVRTIDFELADE